MWEPQKVSEALSLVQGNITVAMMKFAINIKELSLINCAKLVTCGNEKTHDFIVFSALAGQITVPEWSFPHNPKYRNYDNVRHAFMHISQGAP